MDTYHMHSNEDIFPEHNTFLPERWLGDPKGPGGLKPLTHYMVAFSRGSRMCIGLNMAYAELYIGLATAFRRHEFELYETDRSDVDFAVDMVSTQPKFGTKGVRVTVKK
jgi:cytochrome P450